MKLSIVIVNYNVKYFLEQCLLSVKAACSELETEIIVVDNASSDGSEEYLPALFPEVKFIRNKENNGFAKANNQAIRLTTGEYVLLLNPDTIVGEHVLEKVICFMDNHPESGGVGVKMLNGYGNFLPESKRGFPSPWNSFCKMTGLSKLFPHSRTFGRYHARYLNENDIHEVDVLSGAFMMLRQSTLAQTGLLDENFFMYGEDIDLSYRICQAGYKNYYLPYKIIHYKGESTKKDMRYVKNFYGSMLIFLRKHYPHYSMIFHLLIGSSIFLTAGISFIGKIIPRKRPVNKKKEKIFVYGQTSFEEIIDTMKNLSGKGQSFSIFYPDKGISISPDNISEI